MKSTTLGIDLGTNSIGWALVEFEDKEPAGIIDCGVRIFQEAVEVKTRTPKNQERRTARASRRLISRRKMRKDTLREILSENGLFPVDEEKRNQLLSSEDPYFLRKKGLDEKLSLFEFGRAIYHLNQRRGFQSNRKAKDEKEEGKIKKSISELQKSIHVSGCRTLGEYLANQKEQRRRYTNRTMYEHEFDALWEKQSVYYPETLTAELKAKIYKVIFFQRPLKIQKNLIGKCTFEPSRPRAARAHLAAQEFRILEDVNNLRIYDPASLDMRSLTPEEKQIILKILSKQKSLTWDNARKKLGLHENEKFNLEISKRSKLVGNLTACHLRKTIGESEWKKFSEEQRDALVEDILTIEHEGGFLRRMREHWNFDEETAEKLSKIELTPGYARLSLKATRKILHYLREGCIYSEACKKAGYDHSTPVKIKEAVDKLDAPEDLRNPVVNKALWEIRKVVNRLIAAYDKPDTIRIEMARDMKLSRKQREELQKELTKRANHYEQINEILKNDFGIQQPTREDRIKYQLWEECNMTCPYTGKMISRERLFTDEVDIEHILPYSQSLDDSYMNKTLCLASENRQIKRNRSPYETYSANEKKYEEMLLRLTKMKRMHPRKRLKFKQLEIKTDEFISRQLNDTRYICTEVKKYLQKLGVNVDVTKGGATAQLRRKWGIDNIFPVPENAPQNTLGKKIRTDHRHHAIDAIVIALTTRSLFQKLSRNSARKNISYGISDRELEADPPWENFRNDVLEAIYDIVVSHATLRKIHGALHEETAYGFAGESDKKGKVQMVYRVPLDRPITRNQITKIRDKKVRELVEKRVQEFDGIIKKAFGDPENPLMHVDGKTPVHSVRVLTDMSESSLFGVQEDQDEPYKFFPYGSNHHVEIIEHRKTGKRDGVFVTMMEAARRARIQKVPIVQKEHGSNWAFVLCLAVNDIVEVEENGRKLLYRVQMLDGANKVVTFRLHNAATLTNKGERLIKTPNSLKCKKIQVDPIGQIRECHD